jgi:membrane associated rhomboid family serine protease/Zn-finger nucleic acid-binding protein
MIICPHCNKRLVRKVVDKKVLYICPRCSGRAIGLGALRKSNIKQEFIADLWQKAKATDDLTGRNCPHCYRPMVEVVKKIDGRMLSLDVCKICHSIWFDPKEYDDLPQSVEPPVEKELSEKARLALAQAKTRIDIDSRADFDWDAQSPEEFWKRILGYLGFDIEMNDKVLLNKPVMVWGLSCIMVIMYFFLKYDPALMGSLSFIPNQWSRYYGLTLFTSFFLHAGFFHLLVNIYFFIVFGDNVEDEIGKIKFLLLLFGSHLFGLACHAFLTEQPSLPLVGSSAGVSGIVAFYAITYPRAKIAYFVLFWWIGYYRWWRISAIYMFAIYLFQNIYGYINVSFYGSDIAYLAHLGGYAIGFFAAMFARAYK